MKKIAFFLIISILASKATLNAQILTTSRCKTFFPPADTIKLDTLPLVYGSIKFFSPDKPPSTKIDYKNSLIIFYDSLKTQIKICYKVFPYKIYKVNRIYDTTLKTKHFRKGKNEIPYYENNLTTTEAEQIETQGTFMRGVSLGNNQDPVLNASMNLKINGKLTENLNIEAAICDRQLQYTPEGTTVNLSELGNIYIKVYDTVNQYVAGDLTLSGSENFFVKYNKQVKGIKFSHSGKKLDVLSATSVTKGIFTRMEFTGKEGNQGPYKLEGKNHENYILIVAGSERVYVDGEKKQRGLDNDYVIDYNRAEITFTANCPVNSQSRIIVEFQYAQKFYPRFFTVAELGYKTENQQINIGFYSLNDAKNMSFYPLTDKQKLFLAQLGDNTQNAFYPSTDTATSADKIRYSLIDTTVDGKTYKILSYDTAGTYKASFAYLGKNKGNYELLSNGVNGQIYRWIAPKNGIPQGSYEPVISLQAPQNKQIFTLNYTKKYKKFVFTTQSAFSNFDKNTFSDIQDTDNQGFAQKIDLTYKLNSTKKIYLGAYWISENASFLENFRNVEFNRDWNLTKDLTKHQLASYFAFRRQTNDTNKIFFTVNTLKSTNYTGIKNDFSFVKTEKKFGTNTNISFLNTMQDSLKTNFLRVKTTNFYKIKRSKIGFEYQNEVNIWKSDTLNSNSFAFHSFGLFLKTGDNFEIKYFRRYNFLPAKEMKQASISDNFLLTLSKNKKNFNGKITLGYRNFNVSDTFLTAQKSTKSFWGQQNLVISRRSLKFRLFFSEMQGLEPKQKFVFVKTEPTKGIYEWIDYNGNGIQELNEFEIARFPDKAEYVKVFVQTNEYQSVYNFTANQSLILFPYVWFANQRLKSLFKRIKNTSSTNITAKMLSLDISDSSKLVSGNFFLKNEIKFKITKSSFVKWTYQKSGNRQLNYYGIENSSKQSNIFTFRLLFNNGLGMFCEAEKNFLTKKSEFFKTNNYAIKSVGGKTGLFSETGKYRLNTGIKFYKKTSDSIELTQTGAEINGFVNFSKIKLIIDFQYLNNRFNTYSDAPVFYRMAEGLSEGKNFILTLKVSKNLLGSLQMQIGYNGRLEKQKIIHTGNLNFVMHF